MEPMEVVGVSTAPVVALFVVTPGNVVGTERRFQKDLTLRDLKDKLVLVTGRYRRETTREARVPVVDQRTRHALG